MLKTYYILVNGQNKYYDDRYELWDNSILDAQRFVNFDKALKASEELNRYGQNANPCRVEVNIKVFE